LILTTLYSRATFDAVLRKEVDRAGRSGQPLSIILLDVDRLSAINGDFDYGVGDKAGAAGHHCGRTFASMTGSPATPKTPLSSCSPTPHRIGRSNLPSACGTPSKRDCGSPIIGATARSPSQ
jgi:hypothetical protein